VRNGHGQFGVIGRQNQTGAILVMPKVEDNLPVDNVALVKETTADAGAPGFNSPDVPLLVTLALAGLFAIGYFIFGG
jgi:hypothetical protein